jgi:hypothetical protein
LVIDGAAFRPADADLFPVLRRICEDIRRTPYKDPRISSDPMTGHGPATR